jgi:hypothetical protein
MYKDTVFFQILSALVLLGSCAEKATKASAAKPMDAPTWLAASDYVRGELPGIASDVNVYLLADELSDRYIDYRSCRLRRPIPLSSGPLNCDSNLIVDVFSAVADYRYAERLASTGKFGIGFPAWNCAIVATNDMVETTLLVMFHPEFECVGVMTNHHFIGLVSQTVKIRSAVRKLREGICPGYQAPPE